jgi:hypothetical protein
LVMAFFVLTIGIGQANPFASNERFAVIFSIILPPELYAIGYNLF